MLIASAVVVKSSVYPSGADFATTSVAMLVAAPGRFSTTNGWPSNSRELRREQARRDVGAAAGREADQHAHRAAGIGLA